MNTETKWQKERDAFAQGKRIQWKHNSKPDKEENWKLVGDPGWLAFNEYRIHPEDDQPEPLHCNECSPEFLECWTEQGKCRKHGMQQPEPFVPRFRVGDRVKWANFDGPMKDCPVETIMHMPRDGVYQTKIGPATITFRKEAELVPAPWQLPTPPEGQSWHRTDFTEEMLPPGWRPLLKGETVQDGDELIGTSQWRPCVDSVGKTPEQFDSLTFRTRRPLPEPAQQQEKDVCPTCDSPLRTDRRSVKTFNQMSEGPNDYAPCPDPWHSPSQVEVREWPDIGQMDAEYHNAQRPGCVTRTLFIPHMDGLVAVRQLMIDHAERLLAKDREAHNQVKDLLNNAERIAHSRLEELLAERTAHEQTKKNAIHIEGALNREKELHAAAIAARETAEKERDEAKHAYDVVSDRLSASAQAQQGGWISVETRMPDGKEDVLTWDGEIVQITMPATGEPPNCGRERFDYLGVTHWMPIPPLPTQDEKEEAFEAWWHACDYPANKLGPEKALAYAAWLARGEQERGGKP